MTITVAARGFRQAFSEVGIEEVIYFRPYEGEDITRFILGLSSFFHHKHRITISTDKGGGALLLAHGDGTSPSKEDLDKAVESVPLFLDDSRKYVFLCVTPRRGDDDDEGVKITDIRVYTGNKISIKGRSGYLINANDKRRLMAVYRASQAEWRSIVIRSLEEMRND